MNLNSEIKDLPQISKYHAKLLEKLFEGNKLKHAILHLPEKLLHYKTDLKNAKAGDKVTLCTAAKLYRTTGRPYRVICANGLELVYFNANLKWLENMLPIGHERVISGTVNFFNQTAQIVHPDHVGVMQTLKYWQGFKPVYPACQGLNQQIISRVIQIAIKQIDITEDWLSDEIRAKHNWPKWHQALLQVHYPNPETYEFARERLAFDELLAQQLALKLFRGKTATAKAFANPELAQQIIANLPFSLTDEQIKVFGEISKDLASGKRMVRLLQGDVGSGKTLVALLSASQIIADGAQVAFLAPTDLLARQHFSSIEKYAAHFNIALLTGKERGKQREKILGALKNRELDLLVGTHAILEDWVEFQKLGLAIIDEQHRFGVKQRLVLAEKAEHVLSMTATPIPRTVLLGLYGDLAISYLTSKPAYRQPISTKIIAKNRLEEVISWVSGLIEQDAQIYWVCPLIEGEDETTTLSSAVKRYQDLANRFSKVFLLHGKLKPDEKAQILQDFKTTKASILVATTVIEVGIDIPSANYMIIEEGQQFGLPQLHQLRGRIGRGDQAATCMILYSPPLSQNSQKRLTLIRDIDDGFKLAQEDFNLRGGGDLLGTQQSGVFKLKVANLHKDQNLIPFANRYAMEINSNELLDLFERELNNST